MTILAVMVPTIFMAVTEEAICAGINKANNIINKFNYKRKVRERRSRSQRRWA